jgi:predicted CopG family antitoxin
MLILLRRCDLMKTINVTFEDEVFERLEIAKGDLTWSEFIQILITPMHKEADKNVRSRLGV